MDNLKKFFVEKLKSKFFRNIVTLVSGTALAQLAGLMFVPWVTRIYGPEAFGGLGYYSSLLGFLTPIAAFCYPLAIILPKRPREAHLLFEVSLKIAIGMTILSAIVLFWVDKSNSVLIPFSDSYFLVPLGVFLSVLIVAYTQQAIRLGYYKVIATIAVLSSLIGGLSKVIVGYFYPNATSLIVLTIAVLIFNLIALVKTLGGMVKLKEIVSIRVRHWAAAKRYLQFPVYRMPHNLIGTISQIAPIFLLTSFYGANYAGYFALTRAVLSVPVTLIGKAVYDVSYPKISQRYNLNQNNFAFVAKLTGILAMASLIPLFVIFLVGDDIFVLLFGAEWAKAGVYGAWMALWFSFNFSNKAVAAAVSVYRMDGFLLRNGVLNIVLAISGFFIGTLIYSSDVVSIALFSLFSVFCQCLLIIRVLSTIRKNES